MGSEKKNFNEFFNVCNEFFHFCGGEEFFEKAHSGVVH